MLDNVHFDPDELRAALPRFDLDAPVFRPRALDRYYAFYDLDLGPSYPGLEQRIGVIDAADERICVQLFKPLAPVGSAIVCHGYCDHTGIYGHLVRFLLDRNLCVLAFDLPGHGLSTGARATIDSFDRYVDVMHACISHTAEHMPEPWHVFGQSMGGSMVVEHLVRGDAPRAFRNVVLFAPLVRPANWPVNRIVYEVARRLITERPRTIIENSDEPAFVEFLRRDPLQPDVLPVQWVTAMVEWKKRVAEYPPQATRLKIIQGERDGTVDAAYNIRALGRVFDSDILYLPEGRHHLVNSSTAVRDRMWRWLDQQCQWR